jgi:hypothetical protein
LGALAEWLWVENGIYVQMVALIMVTSLVGAIALLKMDKAEQMSSIQGEFGIEAEPELEDEPESVEDEPEPTEEEPETSEPEATEEEDA